MRRIDLLLSATLLNRIINAKLSKNTSSIKDVLLQAVIACSSLTPETMQELTQKTRIRKTNLTKIRLKLTENEYQILTKKLNELHQQGYDPTDIVHIYLLIDNCQLNKQNENKQPKNINETISDEPDIPTIIQTIQQQFEMELFKVSQEKDMKTNDVKKEIFYVLENGTCHTVTVEYSYKNQDYKVYCQTCRKANCNHVKFIKAYIQQVKCVINSEFKNIMIENAMLKDEMKNQKEMPNIIIKDLSDRIDKMERKIDLLFEMFNKVFRIPA